MVATPSLVPPPVISWVKPPKDFVLDDTPVENDAQPLLAGALRESLELTDRLPPESLALSNFGLCVQIGENLTLKAPDWFYVPKIKQIGISRKSYTPNLEGEVPAIVIEFISDTDGEEYSSRPVSPFGKWYFYEQILKVPIYVIFYPDLGLLEFYNLTNGHYVLEQPNVEGRHWIAALELFLGPWRGSKENRDGYWLRWWDETEQILPWAIEQLAEERQRAENAEQQAALEKQRADEAQLKADRLAELLRAQGIDPDVMG